MEKTVYSQSRALADDDGETARSAGLIALKQRPLHTYVYDQVQTVCLHVFAVI